MAVNQTSSRMYHPRKIVVPQSIVQTIELEARKWSAKNTETGGYFIGKIYPANRIYEILYLIDAGPNAKREPGLFKPDNVHATKKKEELVKKDTDLRFLGEWHLHPWESGPHPSSGDFQQLLSAKGLKQRSTNEQEQAANRNEKTQRPWFIIWLWNSSGSWNFFDINEEGTDFRTVPHYVVPSSATSNINQTELMQRISALTGNGTLASKRALALGLGSGGSTIIKYLSATALGHLTLVDCERLETVNVIRHEGTISEIGDWKTEICRRMVETRNPYITTETCNFDVLEEEKKLRELIERTDFDLIMSLSGNARVNCLINKIAIEEKIPTLYAGVYAKAMGGYVLSYVPSIPQNPCFNCLFSIVSKSYYVNDQAHRNYGIPLEELHAQQGLWLDISFVSLMAAKIALKILDRDYDFLRDNNLFLYRNPLQMRAMKFKRREDCVSCNFEEWARKQEESTKTSIGNRPIEKVDKSS